MPESTLSTKTIIQIAVPTPLRKTFDYLNASSEQCPQIGTRVAIEFGKKQLTGVVIGHAASSTYPTEKLKTITKTLDNDPLFSVQLMEFFKWASEYYQYPLGMLFDTALPNLLRKQHSIEHPSETIQKNCTRKSDITLNQEQQQAVTHIKQYFGKYQTTLLDGIAGSGKTEVYMQLAAESLSLGKQVLILVPEINLTPQILKRFQERFNVPIAVMHSQITDKKRLESWIQAKLGIAKIVMGTRLAIFTPLKNPGIFIIDEEHDLSFKQQDHFRYSARDLLLKRAQIEKCPVVLGSATPSLETWHNCKVEKFQHVILSKRAGIAKPPHIELVDIRHKQLSSGLSNNVIAEITSHLKQEQQVLIFLNKRGYAPVLMCIACGWHQECTRCSSNMIVHNQTNSIRCHHCDAKKIIPTTCPTCTEELKPVGVGTQRIESFLQDLFPTANIVRIDRDNTTSKKKTVELFEAIHNGDANILIGTQMLAKGHHFPNLGLVVILDTDSALFSADFRATERMAQLLTQVAGRAGRELIEGKVLIQTSQPENQMLQTIIYQGYKKFLELLLTERRSGNLPPFTYQVLIRAEAKATAMSNNFLSHARQLMSKEIQCFGPIPAPLEKKVGYYRSQLLLQSTNRKILHIELNKCIKQLEHSVLAKKVRWTIDVDPLEMF